MSDINRIEWIDSLKGFGVLAVMFYHHVGISGLLKDYLISFNVPLFFIVYGYLFSCKKYNIFVLFKKIAYPYFLFSIISIVVWLVINRENQSADDINNIFLGVAYGVGSHPWLSFNIALWFLPCLFVSSLIFNEIKIHIIRKFYLFLPAIFLSAVACNLIPFRLPWGIDIAPMAILFIMIGYIIRQNNFDKFLSSRSILDILIVTALISYLVISINGHVGMSYRNYGNSFLFVLGALSGTLFFYTISKFYSGLLSVVGRHSLILFAMHLPIYSLINLIFIDLLKLQIDLYQPYIAAVYVALTTSLLVSLSIYSKKYFQSLIKNKAKRSFNSV